jgi:[ribosomal protein S5]-alanine N-acetyltransferase
MTARHNEESEKSTQEPQMLDRLPAAFATTRLDLRLMQHDDLDDLLVVHGDDEVTRFLPYATWHTSDDGQAWYLRNKVFHDEGKSRQFAIVRREDARVIGLMLIFNVDPASERGELGYVLGKRDWGQRLMREALVPLLNHSFDALGLRRIEAHVDPRNIASHRLLLSLGFRHEGLLRERNVMKGDIVDSNTYGLLKREWGGK